MKIKHPNIRKMFVPDSGHVICEVDIKQGDAQIVAWVSKAKKLMSTFQAQARGELRDGLPIDVHSENARTVFPNLPKNKKGRVPETERQLFKVAVHATNYGAKPFTLQHKLGITRKQAENFQRLWFAANPEILAWHNSCMERLMTTRMIGNIFGFRKIFFGRAEDEFGAALAWEPQSTVALVVNKGIRNVRKNMPFVRTLMQVHDSAIYQIPIPLFTEDCRKEIIQHHLIQLPYSTPLTMGVDMKWSEKSWGDCKQE